MLAAELHNKISLGRPPNQRMEDVLTSYVLSLFRYLNDLRIPLSFLRCGKNLLDRHFEIANLKLCKIFFWPRFRTTHSRNREADALLILEQESGHKTALLVESKYDSGLHNVQPGEEVFAPEEGQEMSEFSGQQLADEYMGIKHCAWIRPKNLSKELENVEARLIFYITTHYEMPQPDLRDALAVLADKSAAESELFWVSWRSLHSILTKENECGYPGYTLGEKNLLDDVWRVLDQRNVAEFVPFNRLNSIESYEPLLQFFQGWVPLETYQAILTA
jgi:hypothetical protein